MRVMEFGVIELFFFEKYIKNCFLPYFSANINDRSIG